MNNRNDEAAFPVPIGNTDERQWGMSLRDWFAGMALASVIRTQHGHVSNWVKTAREVADAMMEAREAKQ